MSEDYHHLYGIDEILEFNAIGEYIFRLMRKFKQDG